MKRQATLCVIGSVLFGFAGTLSAQRAPEDAHESSRNLWVQAVPKTPPVAHTPPVAQVYAPQAPSATFTVDVAGFGAGRGDKLEALADVWRDAESDREREKVEQIASDILGERFDADLERRQEELERIEARVERLRAQLDRRVDSKDEIVQLQVKQMTMSWDGLGWEEASPKRGLFRAAEAYSRAASDPFAKVRGNGSGSLTALVLDAVKREDDQQLEFLTAKLVEQMSEMEPESVNAAIWKLFEATKDDVSNRDYWRALIEAGDKALERIGDSARSANTWDTVAHLYEQLGEIEKAIECQRKAVKLSSSNAPFGLSRGSNSRQLKQYLEALEQAQATAR